MGVWSSISVGTLEPRHSSRRSRIPNRPEKIEIGIQDHRENRRESPLNQDVYSVVVKIAQIYFFGRFGAKTVPEWSLRASDWDPRVPKKSTW